MNNEIKWIRELKLDLTFINATKKLIAKQSDSTIEARVREKQPWIKDLHTWITFIQKDQNIYCPEVVRKSSFLSLGLQFTDNKTIAEMNAKWRQRNKATDVLSFPSLDKTLVLPENSCIELGDIIISIPIAILQAKEHNHSLANELRWLVSHGLLHLLGWEHPNDAKLKEMLACQGQLLNLTDNNIREN